MKYTNEKIQKLVSNKNIKSIGFEKWNLCLVMDMDGKCEEISDIFETKELYEEFVQKTLDEQLEILGRTRPQPVNMFLDCDYDMWVSIALPSIGANGTYVLSFNRYGGK